MFIQISIPVEEGQAIKAYDTLYKIAKELGYTYPDHMNKTPNTKSMGERSAVAKMLGDIAKGKLRVSTK